MRTTSSANERDTHDIVLYFQREMEIKDDIILKLNEELVKCQTQLKFEVEKIRKAFEADISELKDTSEHTISDLRAKLKQAEDDLKAVELFRQEKRSHEGVVKNLEKSMLDQRKQLIDAMEEQERRFLEEKSRLFKDLEDQKTAFREIALKEAKSAMGEDAKKILADNHRMFEELKFHHAESANIQTEKTTIQMELSNARREVSILAEKEIEYAKQAHAKAKEIKILRDRISQLEKQQSVNTERFKVRAKELKSTVVRELEEATLDAAGLRRLIQIKNKELRHMKSLAATILNQRSETEQFFLESLQEVKEVIQTERKQAQLEERQAKLNGTYKPDPSSKKTSLPPLSKSLNMKMQQKAVQEIDPNVIEKVSMRELNWEDKELVLRILFSKMNGNNMNSSASKTGSADNRSNSSNSNVNDHGHSHTPFFVSEGHGVFQNNDPDADLQEAQRYDLQEAQRYQEANFAAYDSSDNNDM